jgi:hypothetical protein
MSKRSQEFSNVEVLQRFWRRRTFHDMAIEDLRAIHRRLIIRLSDYTLIVTGAKRVIRCELPSIWLYESITRQPNGFTLDVETQTGDLHAEGVDVRLLDNSDFAILIPPLDGEPPY